MPNQVVLLAQVLLLNRLFNSVAIKILLCRNMSKEEREERKQKHEHFSVGRVDIRFGQSIMFRKFNIAPNNLEKHVLLLYARVI
mmetsp:Transcript_17099/g.24714  ORF Transcript_17099/g.24714 Transcript_17099/m.24714 type:complete len:84 (+) Transcript_17099:436-687(+)